MHLCKCGYDFERTSVQRATTYCLVALSKGSFPCSYQSTLEYSDDSRDLRRTTEIITKRQNDVDGSKLMERAPIASCMSKYCTVKKPRGQPSHRLTILGERTKEAVAALSSLESCVLLKYICSGQSSSPQVTITRPGRSLGSSDLCGRYTE